MSKPKSTSAIRSSAEDAGKLSGRIAANAAVQGKDLNAWIFEHLDVPASSCVLELCAGTGAQSLKFLSLLAEGTLVATDKSAEALAALKAKAGNMQGRLITVPGDMDCLGDVLNDLHPEKFDLAFCAYGLYYSADPEKLLKTLQSLLSPGGRIAVVGPYGENNAALFSLLTRAGVVLPEYVLWTSRDFMTQLVKPWAEKRFEECRISMLENPVTWKDPEALLQYWRNSTFYDASKEAAVKELLLGHFEKEGEFRDSKHVMLVEMR